MVKKYIDTEIPIAEMDVSCIPIFEKNILGDNESIADVIRSQPAADVVEVVRCKDCVYYNEKTKTCSEFTTYRLPTGGRFAFLMDGNDFCSLGKRKGDKE